jgi:chromatin segregation and condensation protein Rec8/ScpA/Scc1 (kleisin family)
MEISISFKIELRLKDLKEWNSVDVIHLFSTLEATNIFNVLVHFLYSISNVNCLFLARKGALIIRNQEFVWLTKYMLKYKQL